MELNLYISAYQLKRLENSGSVKQISGPVKHGVGNSNMSLYRAYHWMTTRDVATISAWRENDKHGKKMKRSEKDRRNRDLACTLKKYGFGVIKLRGYYHEGDKGELVPENSFLVVNSNTDKREFFTILYKLSEFYDQDSFIHKSADDPVAYEYATNDFTRAKPEFIGGKCPAGELRLNISEESGYSEVGSGKFVFSNKK